MARDADAQTKMAKAHSVFMRLALPVYTQHFKSPAYVKESTLDMMDNRVSKEVLKSTAQRADVRAAIGTDDKYWADLSGLFKAAIPSLERRSFTIWDPSSVDYESTSGALIASHHPGLWKDLLRLIDLVSISRSVLFAGEHVQNLAASYHIETEVFRLINCCVRVTARGFDGDAGTGDEEKWQWAVNGYKKLLITTLQFLNNFAAKNERRKLMLWVALFDNSSDTVSAPEDVPETSSGSLTDVPSNPTSKPIPPLDKHDFLRAYGTDGERTVAPDDRAQPLWDSLPFSDHPIPEHSLEGRAKISRREHFYGNGYGLFVKRLHQLQVEDYRIERDREPTLYESYMEFPRRWAELNPDDQEYWQGSFDDAMAKYRQDLAVYEAKMIAVTETQTVLRSDVPVAEQTRQVERKIAMLEEQLAEKYKTESAHVAPLDPPAYGRDGHLTFDSASLQSRPVVADDMRMLFTAEAGTKILESGKAELMKRLEGYDVSDSPDPALASARPVDMHPLRPVRTDETGSSIARTRSMNDMPPPRQPNDFRPTAAVRQQTQEYLQGQSEAQPHSQPQAPAQLPPELPETPETHRPSTDMVDEAFAESSVEDDDLEESEQEQEEDEEDYPGSTEDGRGLLTDVPLILGPSEIEVLPMLIMSGITPPVRTDPNLTSEERNALFNMHTVRTHLLLSQSNGRNLLRELLIFVAAWDLREEELYFKFMVKIMEAILRNGLMPYAYHAFRDRSRSKDIISPAQAVIMKLLTCIFRARGESAKAAVAANAQNKTAQYPMQPPTQALMQNGSSKPVLNLPNMPSRVDLHILNFIFTEFRQHIIPQTCALIFLQGQIHAGKAQPEDFPLNLWDMERMYEGVYQYLEFFAVLTEEGVWKGILGEWEMASELVTLLRELEGGIPKVGAVIPQIPRRVSNHPPQRALSADAATMHHARAPQQPIHSTSTPAPVVPAPQPIEPRLKPPSPAPVAIERPFDIDGPDPMLPPLPQQRTNSSLYEADTPLAYPEEAQIPMGNDLQHDQDEPSDFEWRNLKKLTVLVLSSLIWKNRTVQDQVRRYGGLEALVSCCRTDEHNPYIREHAIMCLRFAVEGCEENARMIKSMAAQQTQKALEGGSVTLGPAEDVPREVLDANGYETFVDPKGQVGLRRKEGIHHPGSQHGQTAASSSSGMSNAGVLKPRLSSTKLTAERAAELMSSALSSLPLGDKLVTDKQKAEALAKLDRAFETTEKVLGRGRKG
ncbi:Copper transport protein 86 [Pseudocercospora fuligena]|uniref:Ataxin-10 homolog n=1 Tax=Pseudocercospora fuligena TaxID=685502 RepID=A0A8H6RGB9_9PEZI|nr:Copper transport protein 86 [Pseudocercospora fuligena]